MLFRSVPADIYTLTIAGTGEDVAATGDLDITDDLTVTGDGAQTTLVNGGTLDNVFQVIGNIAANFSGLTIRNAGGGTSAGVGIQGGQATLKVTNCSLTDNAVADIKTASGSVTVADSTVNGASKTSKGILSTSGGNITVTDGKFSGNSVAIDSRSGTVTITDSTLSNNFDGLTSLGTATITNSILSNNSGDGIDGSTNLTITGSTISGNTGDGIDGNHILTLTNSIISGNGNDGIDGTDNLTMTNSTLSGNGGDAIDGGITVTMTNSTLSGNGIDGINGGTTVTLNFITIANNKGVGINGSAGTIGNSVVAFNGTNGVLRTLTSRGHNISSDGSLASSFTQPGDLNNTDPKIGPLADNGGPTFTHALLAGSPALDAADGSGAPAIDQRGVARPQGAGFDIGAFELQVATAPTADLAVALSAAPDPVAAGQDLTYTITTKNNGPAPATNIVLTDFPLPANVQFVSTSAGAFDAANNRVVASLGSLPVGGMATVMIVVPPTAAAIGTILSNTVAVTAAETDPNLTNNVAQVVTAAVIGPTPPPADTTGPMVVSLRRFGFHARPTRLVLTLDEVLDPALATDLANYRLTGPCGGVIRIRSAVYDPAARTVILRPARRLPLRQVYRLVVNGTSTGSLSDLAGNALDGDRDGRPSGNFIGRIDRASLAEVPSGPAQAAHAPAWRRLNTHRTGSGRGAGS